MKNYSSFLKRLIAMALALVLLVSNTPVSLTQHGHAADKITKTVGQVVAENYSGLTAAEKELLSSPSLSGKVYSYKALSSTGLVTVDTSAKTITAATEGSWTPVEAVIVANGKTEETVTLTNGKGSYKYTGNAFSVQVTYQMSSTVSEADQKNVLAIPGMLKSGLSALEAGYATDTNLGTVVLAMDTLVKLANGMSMSLGSATVTLSFSEEAATAIRDFEQQTKNNSGQLNLQVKNAAYSGSAVKTQFLVENGSDYYDVFVDTYNKLLTIKNDGLTNNSILDSHLQSNDSAAYTKWNAFKSILNSLVTSMESVVAADWSAAEKGTDLVSSSPNYAELDKLVAAVGTISATPTIKNPLIVDSEVVTFNMAMCDVSVTVVLNTVEAKNDSNTLVVYGKTDAVKVTVAEDATAAEVRTAVKNAGVEADAKAAWSGVYVEGQFNTTTSELPSTVTKDIEYVITYTPKQYSITYDYTTNALNKVYYGYRLTLPVHSDPERAYDYKVNNVQYAQGEVVVIKENTTISRTTGKAYSGSNLYKIISDNYGNATTQAILQSGALKGNEQISVRKPDPADAEELLTLDGGKITATNYDAAYEGLSWVPYTYGANGTENQFSGNSATWSDASVKVKYILRLTNVSKDKVTSVLNLASTLKLEAAAQLETLNKLAAYYDSMGQLDKTKLGALNGVIDVTDFTEGDGTDTDAKNLELRDYFKGLVSGIITNNIDSNNKLKVYNMLGKYKQEGLRYYYENSTEVLNEIDVLSGYLSGLLADDEKEAALKILVGTAGYPEYADKIADLEAIMAEVNRTLTAPNAQIDLTSSKLGTLLDALTADGTVSNKTADYPYIISDALTAQSNGLVMIQVKVSIRGESATFVIKELENGITVTQAMVDELQQQIDAFTGSVEHYTLEVEGDRLEDIVGKQLKKNSISYYSYTPKEYKVTINGEDHEVVSMNDMEITLPASTQDGLTYKYTIDGETITKSTYTFTEEQLGRLFKNGVYDIARTVINTANEQFNEAFENKEGWVVEKDQDGDVTGLRAEIDGTKDGFMGFITDLMDSGFTHVEINDDPLLYMNNNTTEVSLQAMINAILSDKTFSSDTLINLGEEGEGDLFAATLSMGNSSTGSLAIQDMAFTLRLKSVPAEMASISAGVEAIKPYFEYQSNNGLLEVNVNMPERAYEVYLTALLACNEVDKSDITAINDDIALSFLMDYVNFIKDSNATPTTFSNTLKMLGVDADLSGYDEHYALIKDLLQAEGSDISEADGYGMVLNLKSKESIDTLFNFLGIDTKDYETELGMIKEYKDADAGLEIKVNAHLKNVGTSFDALIIDFDKLQKSDKEQKAEGYTFTDNGTSEINSLSGDSIVMLLNDVSGNLTVNSDMILDLNGKTLSGNITVRSGSLCIIDTTLATAEAGKVTGTISGSNITICGGKYEADVTGFLKHGYVQDLNTGNVTNALYTTSVESGDVTVTFNAEILESQEASYVTFAETVAVDLAAELLLNYYTTSAVLSYNDGNLYEVEFENLMELLENHGEKADLIEELLTNVQLAEVNSFISGVRNALLDFDTVAKAEKNNEAFAVLRMSAAPRKVLVSHVTPEDYMVFGITENQDKTRDLTISLEFDDPSGYVTDLAGALDVIVGEVAVDTMISDVRYTDETLLEYQGTASIDLAVDLSKETNDSYTTAIATIMGYASIDATAWVEAANAGETAKIQEMLDAQKLSDFIAALRDASTMTFVEMAKEIGINYNSDTSKLAQSACRALCDLGALLENMNYGNENATLGSFFQNNVYNLSCTDIQNYMTVGAVDTLAVDADLQIKMFCVHAWDDGVPGTTATCTEPGSTLFTCSKCGGTREEVDPATGHDFGDWVVTAEPTCTDKGEERKTCSKCGDYEANELPAKGHVDVIDEAVAATCTTTGLTEGVHCSVCNAVITAQEEIPALGHTEEVIPGYEATCSEDGLTDGKQCVVCDEILVAQEVITATGHVDEESPWHACDVCGTTCSECKDDNGDGKCDICGIELSCTDTNKEHVDSNNDHFCDVCEKRVSWCRDCDRDHKCDICKDPLTECIDLNRNHICDICWETKSACADDDKDHHCDYCRRRTSKCADDNKDHKCDVCSKVLSICVDEDRSGHCDICNATLEWVVRLAGDSRSATARDAADELKALMGVEKFDVIIYASGTNFPDALAGSYLSNAVDAPVLLYFYAESAMNLRYIEDNLSANGVVYLLGGTSAVPNFVEKELKEAGITTKRLQGATRFETNLEILKETGFEGGETVLVCTGYEFADSLSASATGMPILLVNNGTKKLTRAQTTYLSGLTEKCNFILIGGTGAVSAELENALTAYDADGKVERVSGATRFETSLAVAERFFPNADQAVLAYAWMFPDALCGGSIGYALNAPIILTSAEKVSLAASYISENDIHYGYIMGGTSRLTDEVICTAFDLETADHIHTR